MVLFPSYVQKNITVPFKTKRVKLCQNISVRIVSSRFMMMKLCYVCIAEKALTVRQVLWVS